MALLQPQQNTQEEESKPQVGQPQPQINQPAMAQPVQSNIPAQQAQQVQQPQQVQQKQPVKKGTGFTNLSRIMQASRGSGLGQAVAGGIAGQVSATQKGIETAQQRFEDQAQKARLDTDEAAAKRADIVGRFNADDAFKDQQIAYDTDKQSRIAALKTQLESIPQTIGISSFGRKQRRTTVNPAYKEIQDQIANIEKETFTPEGFQVSGGLKTQYDTAKTELETERATNLSQNAAQIQNLQNKLVKLNADLESRAGRGGRARDEYKIISREKQYTESVLQSLQDRIKSNDAQIASRIKSLEDEFGTMSQAEKQSFIESEKDRLLAEKAPTAQEIQDFTKYRTGTYTGPTELEDSTSLFGKAAQTEALGQLARSSGGREELLKRFVGGKDYTSGQRRLDTAILGQERDSGVSEAARQTRGAMSDVERANTAATQKAQELTGRAREFGKETVRQLEEKASPFTSELDTRLETLKGKETKRSQDFGTYQSALAGTDPKYQGMDPLVRAGSVLQDAANKGYLDQAELTELMGAGGQTGLLQRAMNLGLDPSQLLAQRLQDKQAQGLTRAGVASKEEAATLNALNQLLGRQPSELEFREGREQFTAGGIGLGASTLRDYITKTEAERAQKDPVFAQQLEKIKPTYLQQALGGLQGTVGGVEGIIGSSIGTLDNLTDPRNILGNAAGAGQAIGQASLSNTQMMSAGRNAVLEGLLNFNVGGKSIAGTEAGKQLQKALEFQSMLENEALKMGQGVLSTGTDTLSQLGKGNIGNALETLLAGGGDTINQVGDLIARSDVGKVGGNIAREVGGFVSNAASGFGAGKTGNWSGDKLGALGGGKIGEYVNKSSDVILDEFNKISQATKYGKWYDRYEALRTLDLYYQNALKREQEQKAAQSAALQRFLTGNK